MGVKDESEVQRILFAAQSEAKRRGRIELSANRSGSTITDRRGIREAEESSRSARHMRGVFSPEKTRSHQAKEKCHHPYTTISGGRKICSTCGLQLERGRRRVAEEGYEYN
jgi:hypothetical protein